MISSAILTSMKTALAERGIEMSECEETGKLEFAHNGLVWRQQVSKGGFEEESGQYPQQGAFYRLDHHSGVWGVYLCNKNALTSRILIAIRHNPADAADAAGKHLRVWAAAAEQQAAEFKAMEASR